MKKASLFIFLIFMVSCSTNQTNVASNTKQNSRGSFEINKDSLNLITPYIEIKEKSNDLFILHPDKRKKLTNFILEVLKSEYPKSEYNEISFLSKDYRTINSVLERDSNFKSQPAPKELVIDNNNNSIFISTNGYFGNINRGVMKLYVIDNKNGMWKLVDKIEYNNSPLHFKKIKEIILKSLEKI